MVRRTNIPTLGMLAGAVVILTVVLVRLRLYLLIGVKQVPRRTL